MQGGREQPNTAVGWATLDPDADVDPSGSIPDGDGMDTDGIELTRPQSTRLKSMDSDELIERLFLANIGARVDKLREIGALEKSIAIRFPDMLISVDGPYRAPTVTVVDAVHNIDTGFRNFKLNNLYQARFSGPKRYARDVQNQNCVFIMGHFVRFFLNFKT